MIRSGVATLFALALAGATAAWLAPIALDAQVRWNQVRERQHRLQARELALGAVALADGTTVRIGVWTVTRASGSRTVRGPAGELVMTATGERWQRNGARP